MAYSNWGALIYKDGVRRMDREDVAVFNDDEAGLPHAYRIYANLEKNHAMGLNEWHEHSHHAVLGEAELRLCGYKCTPELWIKRDGRPFRIDIEAFHEHLERCPARGNDADTVNECECTAGWKGSIEDYSFLAFYTQPSKRNIIGLHLVEPDGSRWTATCGYQVGAKFEEE